VLISDLYTDTIFPTREAAQVVADANTATEEDGWKYEIEPCIGGFTISVYDENGEFVGNL
jgi:hypothetical protein